MAELRAYIQQLRNDPSLNDEQVEMKIAEFQRNGAPEPVPEPVEEVSEPEPVPEPVEEVSEPEPVPEPVEEVSEPEPVPEPIEEVSEPEPVYMDTDEPEVEEIA